VSPRPKGSRNHDKSSGAVPAYFLKVRPGSTFEEYLAQKVQDRVYWYNIDAATYFALGELQGWACKCCGAALDPHSTETAIDHDHSHCPGRNGDGDNQRSCGKCIRGLLCRDCNLLEGVLTSSPERIKQMILYLRNVQMVDLTIWGALLTELEEALA
jgi:hypothetical protein